MDPRPLSFDQLAHRASRLGDLTEDLEGDREVVRSENPDRVDVLVWISPAEPDAVQTDGWAELLRACDLCEQFDARVVAPLVHDEHAIWGELHKPRRRSDARRQRLLDVDRQAARNQLLGHVGVCGRRRCDDESLEIVLKLLRACDDASDAGIESRAALRLVAGDDGNRCAELDEIAHDVTAPFSVADDSDFAC